MFSADGKVYRYHTLEKYREKQIEWKAQHQQRQEQWRMPEECFRKGFSVSSVIAADTAILKDSGSRNNKQPFPLPDSPVEFFT
jgi:hypothetical protein